METTSKELRLYETVDGKKPFEEWLFGLKDKSNVARIVSRLNRVSHGNLGDVKSVGGETMAKASSSFRESWIARMKQDSALQFEYLKSSLEDNSDMPEAILSALRDIAEARGFEQFAEEAHLSQKALYKILSDNKDSKPRFETIVKLLDALGVRLTVEQKHKVG